MNGKDLLILFLFTLMMFLVNVACMYYGINTMMGVGYYLNFMIAMLILFILLWKIGNNNNEG